MKKIPEDANIITSRWEFKYKKNSKGEITKRKSRLVARSYMQQERTKELIKNRFKIKDIGNVNFIIGIKFKKTQSRVFYQPNKIHKRNHRKIWND